MDGPIGAERQAMDERLARRRRAHGERDHLAAVRRAERRRRAERPDVERARLAGDTLADEPARRGVEAQRRQDGNVLHADDNPHGRRLSPHLAGVENAARVEDVLHGGNRSSSRPSTAVARPDTMLRRA